MIALLLLTLGISLAIQAVFFVFAASLKTDKVTDLSYGLTFISLAVALVVGTDRRTGAALALALMVGLWGTRLATYLLYRIIHMKRDARFDGVREHFWKFFQFWFFQGIVVWIIMLPVVLWFVEPQPLRPLMGAGAAVWLVGLVLETVADLQKFRAKTRAGGHSRWVDTGLWRYSRHPNYFGELLCWWGVFLFVLPNLGPWAVVGIIGPATLTYILLAVTGIPTLEKSAAAKWGTDAGYQAYRARTNRLLPWPRR